MLNVFSPVFFLIFHVVDFWFNTKLVKFIPHTNLYKIACFYPKKGYDILKFKLIFYLKYNDDKVATIVTTDKKHTIK